VVSVRRRSSNPTAVLGLLLAGLVLAPGRAMAQYPRPPRGRFEIHGLDFRPDGAWRKEAARVAQTRRALMAAGNVSALNAPMAFAQTSISGTYQVPVLPIDFPDAPAPFPAADYADVLFNPSPTTRPYSVRSYYNQLSNGLVTIDGTVRPWARADSSSAYYEDNCNGVLPGCAHGGTRFASLLMSTLQHNDDGTFDWSQFDKDGDGYVDFVTFLQSQVDGACGTQHIWAHRSYISAWNGGSPYVTQTVWPGHAPQHIKIEDYTIQSAVGGRNACTAGQIMPIGTISHETGHAFGLPDLYDTDNTSEGIGEWGMMSSGNYAIPFSPARYEAWSLVQMGWTKVDTLTASRTVTTGPVTASDTVFYVPVPGTNEYFLVENRQALESDSAQMNPFYTAIAKSPGLLIWHVDQNQIDAHGMNADNRVNTGLVHGLALMEADGLRNLWANPSTGASNRGDLGDSYPGSSGNTRFSYHTSPAALSNTGAITGWKIDSITQVVVNGAMSFRFLRQASTVFAAGTPSAQIKVNGTTTGRWEEIYGPGDAAALDVTSPQVQDAGRSRFTFTSWSDGQPQAHTVLGHAGPDTIIARFSAEYRVRVAQVGTGTVTASLAGDLAAGFFTAAGTPVTLTASAGAGTVFAGWSGDTAAAGPTLVLPMGRGYNVTASFVTPVPVDLAAAAAALMGGPALTTAQTDYLDQIGNKNTGYDLGDFLALLRINGVVPSLALVQQLGAAAAPKGH
jgi:M6 family metalloprotease-like protein